MKFVHSVTVLETVEVSGLRSPVLAGGDEELHISVYKYEYSLRPGTLNLIIQIIHRGRGWTGREQYTVSYFRYGKYTDFD